MKAKPQIVVVVGPNASGKSDLAVFLAQKLGGEVISADSRQVYRGLDIGSGKITKREMKGIPHHLLDVASPKRDYSVKRFQRDANKAIRQVLKRGKLPIVAGGTGFYIESIVDNPTYPTVKANPKLRKKLEAMSLLELQELLKKKDPKRAKTIQFDNKRRLVRALEVIETLGKVPEVKKDPIYNAIVIGITPAREDIRERVTLRLAKRIRQGMVGEVERLRKGGLSWERLDNFGLEYRYISRYLRGLIPKSEMSERIVTESYQYAKRQLTWFKRDKATKWFKPGENSKVLKFVKEQLS